jgi:hypothetical protein
MVVHFPVSHSDSVCHHPFHPYSWAVPTTVSEPEGVGEISAVPKPKITAAPVVGTAAG